MSLLTWTKRFSVGIEEMDKQHKIIFEVINELFSSMKQGQENKNVIPLIKKLKNYTLEHFNREEEMLRAQNDPLLAWQKKEHENFIAKINEFINKLNTKSSPVLEIEISNFLMNWWDNHITNGDKQYSPKS